MTTENTTETRSGTTSDTPPGPPPEPTADPPPEPTAGPPPESMAPPAAPTPDVRLLRRRDDGRLLGGVCGGFADYVGADVGLVRLLMVVLTLFGGTGVALYAAAWLLVPVHGSSRSPAERLLRR
ncbi:MAG: PspC protein [Nocardioidaceae bacterium]|jgi:phage shock protein PspC (stress-responsive transcriptional regulator)|nr:PspC protein [Nocardioidaceae bacterium]